MRFYVILGCLVSAALLGYVKRPSTYQVVSEATDEGDLLDDTQPVSPLPVAETSVVVEPASTPRPSLLSLLSFGAAILGAVSTVSHGECTTSACLTANIVDTTAALHAASERQDASVPTVVSSNKVARSRTPGG